MVKTSEGFEEINLARKFFLGLKMTRKEIDSFKRNALRAGTQHDLNKWQRVRANSLRKRIKLKNVM